MTESNLPQNRPAWNERLAEPFPEDEISARPQVWCKACRDSNGKVCNQNGHRLISCETCRQRITTAHIHLDYVGHSDTTARLLAVDPYWDWWPAYHDVDRELLLAAIATGNEDIVRAVIDNAPPLRDKDNGMWIQLEVHDDNGNPVITLGYGDAGEKRGPNATKEVIGDAIRNASMRRGVALALWSKSDRVLAEREAAKEAAGGAGPDRSAARRRAGNGQKEEQPPAGESPPEVDQAVPVSAAQELANLAGQLLGEGSGVGVLEEVVYKVAKKKGLLNEPVMVDGEPRQLWSAIRLVKTDMLQRAADDLGRKSAESEPPL